MEKHYIVEYAIYDKFTVNDKKSYDKILASLPRIFSFAPVL